MPQVMEVEIMNLATSESACESQPNVRSPVPYSSIALHRRVR
jgi:hypothetical protein